MKQKPNKLLAVMFLIGSMAFLLPIFTQIKEVEEDDERYEKLREQLCTSTADKADNLVVPTPTATEALLAEETAAVQTVLPALPAVSPSAEPADDSDTEPAPTAYAESLITPESVEQPKLDDDKPNLSVCLEQNEDFIAWLSISGTPISYPVVSSNNTDYYLNHLFTGEKSKLGCLFSLPSSDYRTPSQNIAIYGHHLSHSDAMFSSLLNYKKKSYCDAHPTIELNTIYGDRTYRIFAVLNMKVSDWDAATADFSSREEFLAYVDRARQKAMYKTAVSVDENDHILTLITCDRSYGGVSGRLIVMAAEE